MRFWRIEICHITDIYEKQKDYSVLKNEEKYMIEKYTMIIRYHSKKKDCIQQST